MNAVKATWKNGKIIPTEPVDWPEGSELVVEPVTTGGTKIGLDESQWRDDPEALADWEAWMQSIEPAVLTDEERAELEVYRAEFRRKNLELMRQQMETGDAK